MSTTSLKVTLLMPVLNESANVKRTFAAIFASSRLPDEILIADGGCVDDTIALIQNFPNPQHIPIKIVPNPGVYAGAGRNEAAKHASGDIYICLDFGNEPEEDWIKEIAALFESNPDICAVASPYRPIVNSDFEFCVQVLQYRKSLYWQKMTPAQIEQYGRGIQLGGLGASVRSRLWHNLQGMPDWLRAAEDFLWGLKIKQCGYMVYCAGKAWSRHHMRSSAKAFYSQNFTYARGAARIGNNPRELIRVFVLLGACLGALILQSASLFFLTLCGYIALVAYRPIWQIQGKIDKLSYLYLAPLALFAKEIGTFGGWLCGSYEWWFQKHWKQKRDQYMAAHTDSL